MTFKANELQKHLVAHPAPPPSFKNAPFGSLFTPHMLIIEYSNGAWGKPRIEPFHNLSLPPQASCLHYGTTCFEGMKAYADIEDINTAKNGETLKQHRLRLFRPEMNVRRLCTSMERLCFPAFDPNELLLLIEEFVKTEKEYVPKERGFSLYLRPSAIGTQPDLSVTESKSILLYVIASPVGPYYRAAEGDEDGESAIKPVKLLAEEEHRRAWPGGTGGFKLGANYAGPLYVQREAHKLGYDQVLWLGAHREVQEVGAMNFCVLWRNRDGATELITAPLDGTILPGVTRDSILELAREWGEFKVSERAYMIEELVEALQEGRVIECFGCGTAAIVSPVCALSYRGMEYKVPCPANSLAKRAMREILDIQYGVKPSKWSKLLEC